MKSGILFIFSVTLIFLSANLFTYSQSKTDVPHKNSKQTQEKQVSQVSKTNQVKKSGLKTAKVNSTDRRMTKTSKDVKDQKSAKNHIKKAERTKILKHHRIMQKKTQRRERDNTPHKK